MSVTACLIQWKRQENLPQIIESLTKYPFISEILIRDNSKCENIINYGRYLLAEKASNDIIYTQDDDCIVPNIDKIYERFMQEPDKVCHSGTEGYERVINDNIYGSRQMAMFGWGAMFNKNWINVLDRYTKAYGKDFCFYRETDRIFSILLDRHHNFVLSDIKHLSPEKEALSSQDDHIFYKNLAIERALLLV